MGRRKTKKRKHRRRRRSRKERKDKRSFVRDKCAPKSSAEKLEFSCYTNNSLHKLKKLWNARHPDNVIANDTDPEANAGLSDNGRSTGTPDGLHRTASDRPLQERALRQGADRLGSRPMGLSQ